MRNKQLISCCSRVGTVDNGARPHAPKTARASKPTDGVASRIPLAARGVHAPNTLADEGAAGSLSPCESRGSQCRLHRRSRSHRLVLSSLSLRERRCPRILDQRPGWRHFGVLFPCLTAPTNLGERLLAVAEQQRGGLLRVHPLQACRRSDGFPYRRKGEKTLSSSGTKRMRLSVCEL
jgi:hypothetical protein